MYDNQLINQYDATGGLLLRESVTLHSPMSIPLANVCTFDYDADIMTLEKELYMDNCEYTLQQRGSETVIWSSRFNNNEGYALEAGMMGLHQFYQCKDHLGSVRELFYVDNNQLNSLQSTQYYADGLPMEESTGQLVATEKYNGKKYLEMHGYDCSDYGARHYYPTIGRFTSVDPLAEKYYSISPYAYCAGNPIMFIDPDGMRIDDYYSNLNGKYLGSDGASTTEMRLIDDANFNEISANNGGTTSCAATNELQGSSKVITIDEAKIQSDLQGVGDDSKISKVEHSIVIVLDRSSATITSVAGPTGENDNVPIDYFPAPATGVSFHSKPGGSVIIGQAHGHPASSDPNKITQKTMSGKDVSVATKLQIPVYGVDAMSGKVGKPRGVHRANPDGTINNKIVKTTGLGKYQITPTISMGRNAMEIWGKSRKPTY